MEINDLKYFLHICKTGNINKAAAELRVAPSTLSKSLFRLEEELQIKLFLRVRQSIQITEGGRFLQNKAFEIVSLEEYTRSSLSGKKDRLQVIIACEEFLFEQYTLPFIDKVQSIYSQAQFSIVHTNGPDALKRLKLGEAHIAFTTLVDPSVSAKKLCIQPYRTFLGGTTHPLHKKSRVSIKEVLTYPFVAPESYLYGHFKDQASPDGWRDDKYPRQITYKTSSLKSILTIVKNGFALAHLPESLGKAHNLKILSIDDCAFKCEQKIYAQSLNPSAFGWLNQVW